MDADRLRAKERQRGGFTLLEVLVALAILSMLVLALARLFQQSTVAMDSGWTRAESMMIGRAVTDFVAQNAALALCDPDGYGIPQSSSDGTGRYNILSGTNMAYINSDFSYTGEHLGIGSGDEVKCTFFPAGSDYPVYADVEVLVTTDDKGVVEERKFMTRVLLMNRNRYRYE